MPNITIISKKDNTLQENIMHMIMFEYNTNWTDNIVSQQTQKQYFWVSEQRIIFINHWIVY